MEKYIYNEKNGLWYELQDDYYRELRSSLPRNFTGIRKAICHLQNGSVSENAPGYHKAYTVELAMAAVELGWYKLRFPEEFERACRCTYKNFERKALMQ